MPRNPAITVAVAVAALAAIAGCTTGGSGSGKSGSGSEPAVTSAADSDITVTVDTGSVGSVVTVSGAVSPAGGQVPLSSATEAEASVLIAGAGTGVQVTGDELPRELVDGIQRGGGELADQRSWDARYETFGLPRIVGNRVHLVEATIDARRDGDGWQRTDELQWLFQDSSHNGVDDLLDEIAFAAGVDSWAVAVDSEMVDSAACVERRYTNVGGGPVWRIQGCGFSRFPGVYSVGVGRDGVFDVDIQNVEPTAQHVAATLGGRIESFTVTFGAPAATGSVTTLTTRVETVFDGDATVAAAALTAGPLAGWRSLPGEASVMLAGSPGASWVISDGDAVYSGQARLGL